jgi:hypothetical protein
MPEPQDPDDNQDQEGSVGSKNVQQQREHIKTLERQLREATAAQAERDELKTQLASFQKAAAFDRLNIPPTGPGKLLRDTYQGELTDEAILKVATEYGITQPQEEQVPQPSIPGIDQGAMSRMQQALNGPATAQTSNAHDRITGAKTREELDNVLRELGLVDSSGTF